MEAEQLDALADDFFAAIARRDLERVAAIYDPGVEVWHNASQKTQSREQNLRLLERFTSRVKDVRYEILAREFFPGGFVQRHTLHATAASGEPIAVPACIVVYVADGRIRRLYEYLDAAAVAPAFAD